MRAEAATALEEAGERQQRDDKDGVSVAERSRTRAEELVGMIL